MNAKALLVVLVAVLGFVCWFLLRGGTDVAPGHTAPAETPSATATNATPETMSVERSAAATEAPGPDRTAAPAAGNAGDRGAVVRGRIVDGAGAPRGSVELTIRSWARVDGFGNIDIADLPLPGGQPRTGREPKPTCTTRADGTFQFPLAADRDARLELVSDTLVFASRVPMIRGQKNDQDLGDLVAVKGASLHGVVQDEHGKPIADVGVSVGVGELGFTGFGALSSTKTGADGVFSLGMLRPGKWTLRTASGRFLPTVKEFTLAAEEQRENVVVVVRPGQAIAGQVIDDRGVGVSDCKVGSKRKESRGGVAIERFATDESTTTDANGFFTLSGLSTETATVKTFGGAHTSATAVDVPVGTGNLVLRVERLASVEGVLVGADGTPVAGSRVVARPSGQGPGDAMFAAGEELPFAQGTVAATTAADGTFRVEGVQPGLVTVTATGKTHLPARQAGVQVLPAQTTKGVRLVADLGATARVKVVDEGGAPVAGAKVQARRPEERAQPGNGMRIGARRVGMSNDNGDVHIAAGPESLGTATTDAEGWAQLTGLPAGQVQLLATHSEFAPANAAHVTLPKTGTVDASLTLRTPGFAEVLVTGADGAPASGVSFRVSGPDGEDTRDLSGKTNDAGLG
ncbi:MAG TPA: carboxypeptidase-like regulatory domain-containing protein, partial [Planctomycetota bacterium]|nr:carboxypeptidase-like regulatory domain-containing protein [Planctomycetota bacterium]